MSKPSSRPAHRPARKATGRPEHVATDQNRLMVKVMVAGGFDQPSIALVLGISKPTLRKHYKVEIATGANEANALVNRSLFRQALKGNVGAIVWWDKTRRGMKETQAVEHAGKDGNPIEVNITRGRLAQRLARFAAAGTAGSIPGGSGSGGTSGA
jgi:DNA-binding transcriptional regulator YdaS (Cro superfamily)